MNSKELLKYLKDNGYTKFQSKGMQDNLKLKLNIPKFQTMINVKQLLSDGLIERKSKSGYCDSVCASCYEHGCDNGVQAPINYYQIK